MSGTPSAPNPNKAYLKRIDGLRGLAAICVAVIFHYIHFRPQTTPFNTEWTDWVYRNGGLFVDLFFILSGIIFSFRYQDLVASHRISFRDFIYLRIARLYPLHVLTLVLAFIAQALYIKAKGAPPIYPHFDLYHFGLNLLFLQKLGLESGFSFNAPSWSISIEMLLYGLFFYICHRWRHQSLLVCALMGVLGYILMNKDLATEIARGLAGFFTGVVFYRIALNRLGSNRQAHLGLAVSAALLLICVIGTRTANGFSGRAATYTLVTFPIAIYVILANRFVGGIFATKPLAYLGELSYAIYMIHVPVQMVIMLGYAWAEVEIQPESMTFFCGYAVTVLVTAAVVHHGFEKPMRGYLRQRWALNDARSA